LASFVFNYLFGLMGGLANDLTIFVQFSRSRLAVN